jgi:Asp-tRNA(Asn)/Glu-tRNA(Gln) amidotransferase A subunit family amidase
MQKLIRSALAILAVAQLGAQRPAPPFDPTEKTIVELQDAMSAGRVTSRQLVDGFLARIAAYDRQGPEINAMIAVNPRAREIADALDRERAVKGPRGPLHGIPVVVKDNYDTADMPTTGATLGLASFAPAEDAFQVTKLKEAGAVILGKTNLHELASGITTISSFGGQTRNPYDPSRNAGGSSGGTGAAVAASFAAVGMGSDTCGSIRIPASHNNLVGLRGTAGLSSRTGIIPLSHTQDIGGPLARTVTDLAIALDATVGPDPSDPSTAVGDGRRPASFREALRADALKGTRIGTLTAYFGGDGNDAEMSDAVRRALDEMKKAGAETVEVTIPDLDALTGASGLINHEFKFDLIDYLARVPGAPVKSLGEILERGLHHAALEPSFRRRNGVEARDSEEYRKALDARHSLARTVTTVLAAQRLDAIAYPTMRRRPAIVGEPQGGSTCQLSAQSGLPAISVPAGFTPDGLPVGIELLGEPWSDARLVGLAYAFEQAAPQRRAPLATPSLTGDGSRLPSPVTVAAQLTPDAVVPPTAAPGPARASASFELDRVMGRLRYQVSVTGIAPGDLLSAAIHRGEAGKTGPVLYRLLVPGALSGRGTLALTPRDRVELADGKLYLQIYTRAQPLGALRGQLK